MRITAIQIEQWADKPEAQGLLPVLLRRLIYATSRPTELAIRGADSLNLPGWDGKVNDETGSTWVPAGASRWEMGCSQDVLKKARGDFERRTSQTRPEDAANLDFVFVSPRRWPGKDRWRDNEAASIGHWKSVRAYDADDLEAWLEAAPGVALWLGELIGLRGLGIESVEAYWDRWSGQTRLRLTADAIRTDREPSSASLRDTLSEQPSLIVLEADSVEEAVAFACVEIKALDLAGSAACVTTPDGWRYVDANPGLQILIATGPETAATRTAREGSTLIVPMSRGGRPARFSPAKAVTIVLDRPSAWNFEKALVALGEEESDASRLARSTGRSWSVYRRVTAKNPSISQPAWISDPRARCLTAMVLVGSWNEARRGDIACLQAVTGREYEDFQRDLLHIALLDDAPVLKIGTVWKARAPLELLHLFAPRIPSNELRRFFDAAQAILLKPDPALELELEKRWMAAIYGKVREESGIVIDSIVDSLAKLSFYAENNDNQPMSSSVEDLVRTLLQDADGERWLSLSGVLRELAEASPRSFLGAVEGSLQRADAPVRGLFAETEGNPLFTGSRHADLLWAMEILAWSPLYLSRVVEILAQLVSSPLPSNLANQPINTLISLLRPWWPQTTATPEQRLAALDRLIQRHNDVAWEILAALFPDDAPSASPNAKPQWRDDDCGALGPGDYTGYRERLVEIGARAFAQAEGRSERIAKLIESLGSFEGSELDQVIRLTQSVLSFSDEGREVVRQALRTFLNRDSLRDHQDRRRRETTARLHSMYDALEPRDLVKRHAWMFKGHWVDLPDGCENYRRYIRTCERLRTSAVSEIFLALGWKGIEDLAQYAGEPSLVGQQIARLRLTNADLFAWMTKQSLDVGASFHDPVMSGLLHALPIKRRTTLLSKIGRHLDGHRVAAIAAAAPCDRRAWKFIERQSTEVQELYWQNVMPGGRVWEGPDLEYLVDHLSSAGRQRTAFHALALHLERADPMQIVKVLEAMLLGFEPSGPLPHAWQIGQAISAVHKAGVVSRRQVASLEFFFFEALRGGDHGARNLYAEMLENPALFMECICLLYRPRSQPPTDEPTEEGRNTSAQLAWRVLHHGRGVPGQSEDGTIDRSKFESWITEVRRLAAEQDRREVTDVTIGEWLSSCPANADGSWPCLAVRDLLEQPDAGAIRSGFGTGLFNSRGVTSRALDEGGRQEREIATRYRANAAALHGTHPQTATLLEAMAERYEEYGRRHDEDSALGKEGVWWAH